MTTIPRGTTIAQAELEGKFSDVLCNETGVTARFTGNLSSIVGGQNKWKFMKGISGLTRQRRVTCSRVTPQAANSPSVACSTA